MKPIYKKLKLILFILISVLTVSCSNILDIDPISYINEEAFWSDNNDANLGVIAIYDAMQRNYRGNHFYWGEFRADNFMNSDQENAFVSSLINNDLTQSFTYVQWNHLYTMIFRANKAISKIPLIENFDRNLLGEAYALRAYAYFDAYRTWGDMPLIITSELVLDGDYLQERAPKEDVINLVLSDIAEAEKLITTQNNDYRFSKASVLAFKGRVYMYLAGLEDDETTAQDYYVTAKGALDDLVAMNSYELTTTQEEWRNLFLNDPINYPGQGQRGPELILSLRYDLGTDGDRASSVNAIFLNGIPSNYVNEDLVIEWKTKNDYRYEESVSNIQQSDKKRECVKYAKSTFNARIDDTNIVLFRYADMLLLLAEAENQLGHPELAFDLVDEIRVARKLELVTRSEYTTIDEIEDLILEERRFELFGEGTRWWDLVRTGNAKKGDEYLTEEEILWPIYFRHLIDNPKLTQNLNYQ